MSSVPGRKSRLRAMGIDCLWDRQSWSRKGRKAIRLRRAGFLAIVALGCARCVARAQDAPFARVPAALAHADVRGAEAAARETLERDTVPSHRLDALVALANLAWRVHHDTASASRFVRQISLVPLRDARAVGLIQEARSELELHDFPDAMLDAREALLVVANVRDRVVALDVLARAILAPVLADTSGPVDRAVLIPLIAELEAGIAAAPGELTGADNLLMAGLAAHDGPAVLTAWQDYYLLLTNRGATNVLRGPRDTLRRILPTWNRATDSPAMRRRLMYALADSRFFEAAAYLARRPLADGSTLARRDRRAKEIVAYASFLAHVKDVTDEYYRLSALVAGDERAWRDSIDAAARVMWSQLTWPASSAIPLPPYTFGRFLAEAERRFGLVATFGATGGFRDAHIGHIVSDEHHQVTQWGHTAAFRFVELDHMASNGFLSWFGDGRLADGGWTNSAMVAQVRPSYTLEPSVVWEALTDSVARAALDKSIAADSVSDLERARATPVAYFPSVSRRLDRAGELTLLDSLRRAGLAGNALRERFVLQLSDETRQFSIFQHEGRHAIDLSMGSNVEPELTAKLAQVEFGPRARTAFRGIMTASVGDDTPHGQADARVLRGLMAWMARHASEIKHLDRREPLLPQVPLLTDAQLRAAFRGMDPLAPHAASGKRRDPLSAIGVAIGHQRR